MTFADVNRRANQLARHLCNLGVTADVPVAVLMERSFELIIAMMGMPSEIACCCLVHRCLATTRCLACLQVGLNSCHKDVADMQTLKFAKH